MATGNPYEPCPQEDVSHFSFFGVVHDTVEAPFPEAPLVLLRARCRALIQGTSVLRPIRKSISRVSAQRGIKLTTPEFEAQLVTD